ncbi:kinase [Ktedonobacter sp. SOSP1-85]|uniref:bifunctional aminoglycoside phosphotransferase/ATP-binding protein n=1 Tax=Ktedonobacter sp. SOSP1-85 TaxID=2778367 RepID=UPI0019154193|nr:AAA family ATPase [Ktedonobacter sp. SOSP1-85]GHO76771.1 kinase [Ktedonobacter sp. SOSP1-85]
MSHSEQDMQQENLFLSMLRALREEKDFSCDGTQEISEKQTHLSVVLLTPQYVYKIKKPRDFGFCNYTTPSRRRYFCLQEVLLNASLAPNVYLGVAPILRCSGEHFRIGPVIASDELPEAGTHYQEGIVIDYAVVMRRLPEDATLASLIQAGQVTPEMMREVAQTIAHFHMATPTNASIITFGDAQTIQQNWEENFRQIQPYIGRVLEREAYDALRRYVAQFLQAHGPLFTRRLLQGRIRDCHGDLRLQHVYVLLTTNHSPTRHILLLDRIEFNERFRYGDVASEVAFLVMELEMAQHHDLAMNFLQVYIAETGDTDLYTLLPFYICYRACVRGKVTAFLLDDPEIETNQSRQAIQEASDLFAFAVRTTNSDTHHPLLLCIGGLMGSGKSTLAQALQQHLSFPLFSSDVIRKQLTQQSPAMHQAEHYGKGTYTPSWNRKTYAALAQRALLYLEQGQSVILDASFSRREERQVLARAAMPLGARIVFIECVCPPEVALARLHGRWQSHFDGTNHEASPEAVQASDGRPDLYAVQAAHWEPFESALEPWVTHILLTTTSPLVETVQQLLTKLPLECTSRYA